MFGTDAELSPRFFSMLGKRNRECYLTRNQFIWPFTGDPVQAAETMLDTMRSCRDELERDREELGV